MKKRVFAVLTALPILLSLAMFAPSAGAATPRSLVRIESCTRTGSANISSPGSRTTFRIIVSFQALIDGDITDKELQDLEVTLGSSFSLVSGQAILAVWRPFHEEPFKSDLESRLDAGDKEASFDIEVRYNGTGNSLDVILGHKIGALDATDSWSFPLTETIPPPPPEYTPPDYTPTPTPQLSISGSLPELEAGKNGSIRFTLSNNSQAAAYGISVTILDGGDSLFRPAAIAGNTVSVGTIPIGSSNSRSVSIPIAVLDDVPEGYYSVPVQIAMRNNAGDNTTQTEALWVFVKNPRSGGSTGKASLTLDSATVDKNTPGSDGIITLTMAIANIGDGQASEARVSLTGFKSTEITLNESLVTKSIGTVESGRNATITYSLRAASNLESGSYPLSVEVRYKQPDGTEATMTDTAYINIIRPAGSQNKLQLTGISQDISNPGTNNIIRLTLSIQNVGTAVAQDVSVGFSGLSSSSFTLSGDFGDRRLDNIAAEGTVTTTFSLYVSPSLTNGNYPLTVILKYSDPGAAGSVVNTIETEVYIRVNRPEEETPDVENTGGVPRVIISRHSLSVENVVAGSPFELNVTLLNTSETKNVQNMKVTFTDVNGIFIPVAGVNSFYIPEIPIGQTSDISITLSAKQDAETKSYPLTISFEYEDDKNAPYTVTESLSIPVYLPQRLEFMNVFFFDQGMGNGYLSFQFVNKGKSPLYNMNIRIEGPMTAMEGDYYIGTFGAGQMDYFEDTIMAHVYGEVEGFIVLEFEDSAGTFQEVREPLFTYIGEPFWPGPGESGGEWPMDPGWPGEGEWGMEEEGGGMEWYYWAIIGGGVLVVLIITISVVKKSKRKKLELEDYE